VDLYLRQQFDVLLQMATERLTERAAQRCAGAEVALERLRTDPDGEGVWLGDFVDAFFEDALLDNTAGACFVLQALEKRPLATELHKGSVGEIVQALAKRAFRDLLTRKTTDALSQQAAYGG